MSSPRSSSSLVRRQNAERSEQAAKLHPEDPRRDLIRHESSKRPPRIESWCVLCTAWRDIEFNSNVGRGVDMHMVFVYGYTLGRDTGEKRPICSRHRGVVERVRQVLGRKIGR